MNQPTFSRSLAARFFLYTVVVFAFMLSLNPLLIFWGRNLFVEYGLLQWFQFSILLGTGVLILVAGRKHPEFRELLIFLACLYFLAAIREQDDLLDKTVPVVGWKIGFLLLIYLTFLIRKEKIRFMEQITLFFPSRAFALLWAGVIIAVPLAQLLGHGELLQTLMRNDYSRTYKAAIEESGETVGYLLLLAGGIETLFFTRDAREKRLFSRICG